MTRLSELKCVPCKGGASALQGEQLQRYLGQVTGWEAVGETLIAKTFKFPNFVTALEFVNKVGALAEEQQHHPDISLGWGRVRIELSTHKVRGLTENDFILADKIDQIPRG